MSLSPQRYSQVIDSESARFRDALTGADPQARVPTCPEWNTDDLLFHLYEVQTFWARVLRDGVLTTAQARALPRPQEPGTRGELFSLAEAATVRLLAELDRREPSDPAWSWSAEQSVGFTMRRQAHEATIHRIDAELTGTGASTPVGVDVAEDGVDEALRVHVCADPPPGRGGEGARPGRRIRVVATDTGATWMVSIVQEPSEGAATTSGTPRLVVAADDTADGHGSPGGLFSATAEDLYRWFWGRPALTAPKGGGDLVTVAEFERLAQASRG